ncbi:hypothetical protein EMPS_01229 [Entomortierella parvispora]|uniref:Uncharacterized protein n=1 Tax=Entomortierella parvispora TaxID=205924 RepID=A0A9P3H2G0_9FUNG|nr:hypothetical protein EMPS_01229 [Entomortierella parvispora]
MAKKSHCNTLWGQLLHDSRELAYQVWTRILKKSTDAARGQKGQNPNDYRRHPYSNSPYHRPCWSTPSPPLPSPLPASQQQPFQFSSGSGIDSTFYLPLRAPSPQTSIISTSSSYTSIATLSQYESLWEVQLALQEIPDMMDENLLTPLEGPPRSRADPLQKLGSSWSKDDDGFLRSIPPRDQPPVLLLDTESPAHDGLPGDENDQGEEREDDDGDEGEEEGQTRGEDQHLPLCYLENEPFGEQPLLGAREPSQILFYPSLSLDSLPIESENSPWSLDDKHSFDLDQCLQMQRKRLTKAETPQEIILTPGASNNVTAAAAASLAYGDAYAGDSFLPSIAYESLTVDNGVPEEENEEETEGRDGDEGVWKWDERRQKEMTKPATAAVPRSAMTVEQEKEEQHAKYADRHDRKDSGFFMHDEEEGVFVQVCSRLKTRRPSQRRASTVTTTGGVMDDHTESDSSDWSSEEEEEEEHRRGFSTMHTMHTMHMYI